MAPKPDRNAFVFAMAATVLAIMTWAAFPNESGWVAPVPPKETIYRPDWIESPLSQNRLRGLWERAAEFSFRSDIEVAGRGTSRQ